MVFGTQSPRIKEIKNFGANDTLHVYSENGKTHLIPFVKSRVILEINRKKNSLLVDWEEDF